MRVGSNARRPAIVPTGFNAVQLRPHIEGCGYRHGFILPNVQFGGGAGIALAAFAYPPFDARSACIVAVDGPLHSDTAGACRKTGAPILLLCHQGRMQWWKLGPVNVRPIGNPVDAERATAFFQQNSGNFAPQRVYRAKTWARFDKQLRLPFVNVDLLPVVERNAGLAVKELVEGEYARLQRQLGWTDPDASQGHWMLQAVFWLVSAKMLQDKGVQAFSDLDLHDVTTVLDRVAQHHGAPATKVSRRQLPRSLRLHRLLRATRICASPQRKRSHSCTRMR